MPRPAADIQAGAAIERSVVPRSSPHDVEFEQFKGYTPTGIQILGAVPAPVDAWPAGLETSGEHIMVIPFGSAGYVPPAPFDERPLGAEALFLRPAKTTSPPTSRDSLVPFDRWPCAWFDDAEAGSRRIIVSSSGQSAAWSKTWHGLLEGTPLHGATGAMVTGIPLVTARTCPANPRAEPVSGPSPKEVATARRRLARLVRDYEALDRERSLDQLAETAALQARLRAPLDLLDDLALVRGLSWHTIASMIAVTPTAIRKWRRGSSLTPDNRQQLASLVAFFDLLEQVDSPPHDLGSWVEMPVCEDTTLTPAAIYRGPAGRWLLLDWVRDNLDTTSMLDRHEPRWRTAHAPDPAYRVGVGPDGESAIVPR